MMNQDELLDVVIIGGGPAAYSASLYTARYRLKHVVFEGTEAGGQLLKTTHIENYPGVGKCNGYELVIGMPAETKEANRKEEGVVQGSLNGDDSKARANFVTGFRSDALDQGAQIISETVTRLDLQTRPFIVYYGEGKQVRTHSLILATGAIPRQLVMPSNPKDRPFFNLLTCAVCDGRLPHFKNRAVAVLGGGDSACEDAIFLAKTSFPVYLIHRSDRFRASAVMLKRARETPGVVFLTHTIVVDAFYDEKYEPIDSAGKKKTKLNAFNALRLRGPNAERDLPVSGLFFAIGHDPATALVKGQLDLTPEGYIKIIPGTETATSIEGVAGAGDCQDSKYRQAVRAISSGCEAAFNINRYLLEH